MRLGWLRAGLADAVARSPESRVRPVPRSKRRQDGAPSQLALFEQPSVGARQGIQGKSLRALA